MSRDLFVSVDDLLAPATLSCLAGQSITSVRCQPLTPAFAKSGSRILLIETNAGQGPRFVLKCVSLKWDWLMRATEDYRCRSVTLWQHGILDRLPPAIDHTVVACTQDGAGWAILLHDVGAALMANRRFSEADNRVFLDAMAAMHATFFEAPALSNPALGLCELRHVYDMFAPRTGQREAASGDEIPQRLLEGWELVQTLIDHGIARLTMELLNDPSPLCAALARYPATLVHGDWRHANQGLLRDAPGNTPRVVLLDWQLAVAAPPAVELGRYLGANAALLPISKEDALAYYRWQLTQRLGSRFSDDWWQPQLALGLLGGFVQDGWAMALKATHWHVGADARDLWRADLRWWAERVRAGARWL